MSTLEKLNILSNKIKEIANSAPIADANKNMDALLKSALTKMALISREEFDIQAALLVKTQATLADLERKLTALESLLKAKDASDTQSL